MASSAKAFSIDVDAMPRAAQPPTSAPSNTAAAEALKPTSSPPLKSPASASSRRSSLTHAASPAAAHLALANALGRASPRHLSPATSQIFERDVQEPAPPEASPAIPNHVLTEDHIPPILEASSHIIADNVDPDDVEIVQHASHQPAAVSVATQSGLADHPAARAAAASAVASGSQTDLSTSQTLPGGLSADSFQAGAIGVPGAFPGSPAAADALSLSAGTDADGTGSSYGALNPQDPRRLSFISFADVVHAEHAEQASDAAHLLGSSASPTSGRSPSPAPLGLGLPPRSPRSPLVPASPRHVPGGAGGEASPVRGGAAGSFASAAGTAPHGELVVESMRAALQKTGSNDVGGVAPTSQPLSATSAEDLSASPPVVASVAK